jgi:copper chaperone
MDLKLTPSLQLAAHATAGCSCRSPHTAGRIHSDYPSKEHNMSATTASYPVTGITCGQCVDAVTGELSALPGVTAVNVDLVPDGTSTVSITSDTPIDKAQVAAGLDEAGDYRLATD